MAIVFPDGTQNFPGKVCQIKFGSYGTQTTINPGSSWIASGLSVTITPESSSNKILVIGALNCSPGSGKYVITTRLYRGTTHTGAGSSANSNRPGTWVTLGQQDYNNYGRQNLIGSYIDSPNTTSAITYNVYVQDTRNNSTVYINRGYYDANTGANPVGFSWILAIELEDS